MLFMSRPKPMSGRPDLNRRSRAPDARAVSNTKGARLSHALMSADTRSAESAQRESNPHFRHGKAVGCRYIMGADEMNQLSKNFREHRVGLEPTSPHYGCGVLAAKRPVLVVEWDRRGSNPHLSG
jgi:hypothetical protein